MGKVQVSAKHAVCSERDNPERTADSTVCVTPIIRPQGFNGPDNLSASLVRKCKEFYRINQLMYQFLLEMWPCSTTSGSTRRRRTTQWLSHFQLGEVEAHCRCNFAGQTACLINRTAFILKETGLRQRLAGFPTRRRFGHWRTRLAPGWWWVPPDCWKVQMVVLNTWVIGYPI